MIEPIVHGRVDGERALIDRVDHRFVVLPEQVEYRLAANGSVSGAIDRVTGKAYPISWRVLTSKNRVEFEVGLPE